MGLYMVQWVGSGSPRRELPICWKTAQTKKNTFGEVRTHAGRVPSELESDALDRSATNAINFLRQKLSRGEEAHRDSEWCMRARVYYPSLMAGRSERRSGPLRPRQTFR